MLLPSSISTAADALNAATVGSADAGWFRRLTAPSPSALFDHFDALHAPTATWADLDAFFTDAGSAAGPDAWAAAGMPAKVKGAMADETASEGVPLDTSRSGIENAQAAGTAAVEGATDLYTKGKKAAEDALGWLKQLPIVLGVVLGLFVIGLFVIYVVPWLPRRKRR